MSVELTYVSFNWSRYILLSRPLKCAAQHGIWSALFFENIARGPLLNEMEYLRDISGATKEEWERFGPDIVRRFFVIHRGMLVNQEAMDVRHAALNRIKSSSRAGKKAVAARWKGRIKKIVKPEPQLPLEATDKPDAADDEGWDTETPEVAEEMPPPKAKANGTNGHKYHATKSDITIAFDRYNIAAEILGLPLAQKLTKAREIKLKKRLEDVHGLDGWDGAMLKLNTPGLCGANNRQWKADIDFVLQESSFTKLMEGRYDNWNERGARTDEDVDAAILRAVGPRIVATGVSAADNTGQERSHKGTRTSRDRDDTGRAKTNRR